MIFALILSYIVSVSSLEKTSCINGIIVSVELNKGTRFPIFTRDVLSVRTGVAEAHPHGCVVAGYLYYWEDISWITIDTSRSVCNKGNHVRFRFRPYSQIFSIPFGSLIAILEWVYRVLAGIDIDGIVIDRHISDGCKIDNGVMLRLFPWWGITDIKRVVNATRLDDAYCRVLPCVAANKEQDAIYYEDR